MLARLAGDKDVRPTPDMTYRFPTRAPQGWSHGLGLGGVRKRVKQLGGQVAWRERSPRGIECELEVPGFCGAAPAPAPLTRP